MDIVVYKECRNIVSILLSYSFLFGQFEHLFFFCYEVSLLLFASLFSYIYKQIIVCCRVIE
jgi:hypothetical protein